MSYNCKIIILSTCTFENTPIIYEYVKRCDNVITYIETCNFNLTNNKNNINVEMKQIATSLQMLQFIEVNIKNADLIILFEIGTCQIPETIMNIINNKPQLKIHSSNANYKKIINNKIAELCEQNILHQIELPSQIEIENVQTIFGKTNNHRLISIDKWLDRYIFCCGCI